MSLLFLLIAFLVLFFLGRHLDRQNNLIFAIFMSSLLYLILSLLISWLSMEKEECFFYINIVGLSMIIISLIYKRLYNWRKVEISFFSYFCFFCNFMILCFYIVCIYLSFIKIPMEEPIYIEKISEISQYKYFIFVTIGTIGLLIFILLRSFRFKNLQNYGKVIFFPYLYLETIRVLSSWEEGFFGEFFNSFSKNFLKKPLLRFILCILHIFLSLIIPLLFTLVLLKVTFFHGDLQIFIKLLPLSFISWLYRHIFFYFYQFINTNLEELKEYLHINSFDGKDINNEIIELKNISLSLSQKALSEFEQINNLDTNQILKEYADYYIILGQIKVYFLLYNQYSLFINYIIFLSRYISWIFITLLFFFPLDYTLTINILSIFVKPSYSFRPYATKAYFINKPFQKQLEKLTNGAYSPGHPVATDIVKENSKEEVPFYHQGTHGAGPSNNPSKELHPTEDYSCLSGSGPQNAVYPPINLPWFPKNELGKEIPGSESFYGDPLVKNNDMKNRGGNKPDFEN